jgi:hypothetical protein
MPMYLLRGSRSVRPDRKVKPVEGLRGRPAAPEKSRTGVLDTALMVGT